MTPKSKEKLIAMMAQYRYEAFECSKAQWDRYRDIFSWVDDIKTEEV